MYSGTLGMKHNPEILLNVALHYQHNNEVRVVIISEGIGAEWLKSKKDEFKLNNLLIIDFQPFNLLPMILSTADVFIAILEPSAGIFSVPSKVLTYLCFKRPILMAVPAENLSAKIVSMYNLGSVVHPANLELIMFEMDKLIKDSSLKKKMGENALNYAKKHFNINRICDLFEGIVRNTEG
jgi:glycosyltransferase involved in cell wall biosynthesis